MTTAVVVFTRDLRVTDNPVLATATRHHEQVVPLFVVDQHIDEHIAGIGFATPGRQRFLAEALADLDRSLRRLDGRLVVRRGEFIGQVCRVADQVGASEVHIAADVSAGAQARQRTLRDA